MLDIWVRYLSYSYMKLFNIFYIFVLLVYLIRVITQEGNEWEIAYKTHLNSKFNLLNYSSRWETKYQEKYFLSVWEGY